LGRGKREITESSAEFVSDDLTHQEDEVRARATGMSALAAKIRVFEAAIDHMDQGLLVLDRENRVSLWNKRYEALWDFPSGLLRIGVPLADLIRFDVERRRLDAEPSEHLLRQRLARAENFAPTTEIELPQLGRILRIDHHPLPGGGSVASFTDVTAARRQTEALAASEARFAAYVRMSTDWIWEQDADLRFTFVSRPPTVEVEVFPGENVGKRRDELELVIEDQEAWRRHLDDLAARRSFRHFGYGRRDHENRLRHIVISGDPIFAPDGTFLGYRGTGTDVTAEREALERARAAEVAAENAHGRLLAALETISQGFAIFDADDRLVTCNRQYLDPVDPATVAEMVGRHFEDLVRASLASGWRGYLPGSEVPASPEEWLHWRLAVHRSPPPEPFVYRSESGRWLMINERRTADGGTVAMRVDITELKQTEQDLRAARDEAETASRAKNEFLASMSHELRTPLNAIMGFAEILKDEMFGALGVERYRGYAENIHASATYLMELIRDVLDMSKIEAGRMDLILEPIEVMVEIDRCLGMMAGSARSAGLVVETRTSENRPQVRADSRALRQILLNLLSNAVKFTPSGGLVRLSVASDGDWVRIAVSDTGVGIPAWALPRLGRPFEQVDNVLQRKRPGSGLGLALSRSLAELMGGKLVIESAEGRGTTVTLSLRDGAAKATE
jgi:signal transduction histidine kinase